VAHDATSTDLYFLDERERRLVLETLAFARRYDDEQRALVEGHLLRLGHVAELIRQSPRIGAGNDGEGHASLSGESLADLLCRVPSWDLDLHIPTKAVVGQAYLVAKINFLKGVGYALEALDGPTDLRESAEVEIAQSIHSKLAEELFLSLVTDPLGDREVKLTAARARLRIWDDRLVAEADDFAPVLDAIWQARDRLRPVLGTMRGTQEFFLLLRDSRDHRFLDYFSESDLPDEQHQAFEEFLFGISFEEITRLRDHLATASRSAISQEEARKLLGRDPRSWAPSGGPQALYTSFKRRRVKANYRSITGASGPKKTAEEYVMIALYKSGSSR